MRMKTLQMKRARRAALLFLLLCVAGMTKALAQTEGALNGVFTINDSGGKVLFSQGNLQYIGNATTPYWKFADRQWNYLGSNGQGGTSQSANRDLFGYGTSGYNHGATAYQPWATSTTNSHYYAYGSDTYNLYDQTGQADWGYNAIRNGGNQENSGWRTLTMEEWVYVFDTRNTASGIRYAKGKVNDVCGVILLPDYWNADYYTLNSTNTAEANYTDNVISADIWTANLEANGAVFLPAAGRRQGTSTTNLGTTCYYWSSSYINSSQAYELFVSSSTLVSSDDGYRYYGRSVRLVRNISQTSHTIGVSKNPVDGGIVTGGGTFDVGQSCTVTATANDGYTFLYWTKNGNIVSTNSTYTFYVFGNMDLVANFMLGSNIDFADDNVKALCVANWDTNGDGELSYAEAATVTSLGYVFCNNSEITSFEELQYFIGLNSIGDYAFFNCTNLTGSLFIPYSVTTIGESAFYNCSGLTGNLYIPNSVTAIGGYAFCECFGFTGDLAIPNSVTFLGEGAFQDCYGLTGCLTIPSSVSTISDYTFAQCYNFSSMMVLSETPPMLGDYVFWDWNTSVPVYVPCGHEDAYSSMSWGGFSNFNGICGGTVTVAANPVDGGTVTGGGTYGAGETCTVTATANDGYVFATWTKNGSIVSENTFYTFYVTENCNLMANFVLEGNIVFADDNVKALCVANWDTNGDGELSYAEAAAVTDLGYVFQGNVNIISFEELQYFIGLTSIGDGAFASCTGLTTIEIPNSVTSIGDGAFASCTGLTSIEVPNPVTSIGDYAFVLCSNLTSIEIPQTVVSIGEYAISGCIGLEHIMVASGNPYYDSRESCNAIIRTADNTLVFGCKNTVIPNTVVSIGDYAFSSCTGLTSIGIPNSVTSIGDYAFIECTSLTSLEIPNSVTSIGDYAFSSCTGLTSIGIPNSVTTIGNNAFYNCYGLNGSLTIGNSVETIGNNAFYNCYSLTGDLIIPNSVTSIGNNAFYNCYGLDGNLTIGNSVETIGNYAFYKCEGFTGSLNIPNSVTLIGNSAFSNCNGLDGSLTIGNSVGTIGNNAFYNCYSLTGDLIIPNSVTSLGNYSFYNCYGLDGNLTIGNSVETIGNYAFYYCYSLTGDLFIPNSVTSIGGYAFYYCKGLDGVLTISNSVTSISNYAFYWCTGLNGDLIIPNSVSTIGNYAFYYCHGLTGDLVIPNSVTSIGNYAFDGCSGMHGSLTIGNAVTTIGDDAFYNCSNLTGSLVIPSSVTSIGTYAFGFCRGLTEIWCKGTTPPTISDKTFFYMANMEKQPVYVPCGALSNYQSADYWSEFTDYSEYSNVLVVRSNDNYIGSASITQNASCSENECTVHAEAYSGGAFVNWTTPNGMEISTEADYTFNLTEDVILVANFNRLPNHYVFVGGGSTWYWNDVDNWDTGELPNATSTVTVMSEPNVNEDVTVASMTVCNDSWVYVYDNASLTVTGTLNTIGSSTISVDEGSQLYHANDGVKVRAYKTISPYTEGESDGWHLIASPIANDVAISSMWILTSGKYDLYYYDEPTHYWMNQKQTENHFDALENTKGYLYGNEGSIWAIGFSPINTYRGYSISECLFRASELEAAGLSGTLTSLSWYANNSTGAEQSNISIWMANVSDTQLTSTSHNTSSMTLVYTGSMTPVIGWNEFAFNEGSFTWDGTSNVIVCVQRNKGAIGSEIQWRCNSNDLGFVAVTYNGNNTTPYDMESNTYSVSTSSYYRPDIIFRTATTNAQIVNSVTPKNLSFSGTAKDGTAKINIPLSYASADGKLKGFNLIGNPFVHNVTSFASTNVAEECYRMNDTKDNLIVSEVSTSKPLKPAEGFFVKATAEGASITFNNGAKGETTRSGRINLELGENGKLIDRFIVKQEGEPLEKMSLKENGTRIFASNGNQEMAVVTAEGEEQAVSFKAAKNGTYTLSANVENMSVDYLHLIDNLTGTDVNLLVSPEYTFNAKTTDYTSRFRLVFRENSGSSTSAEYFAFISNGEIVLTDAEAGATLQIVDVIGRIIVSKDAARRVSTAGIPAGVYVLRLINGNDVKTQKIVIE